MRSRLGGGSAGSRESPGAGILCLGIPGLKNGHYLRVPTPNKTQPGPQLPGAASPGLFKPPGLGSRLCPHGLCPHEPTSGALTPLGHGPAVTRTCEAHPQMEAQVPTDRGRRACHAGGCFGCGVLSLASLQQNLIQATDVSHMNNFRFSSNHIFKK